MAILAAVVVVGRTELASAGNSDRVSDTASGMSHSATTPLMPLALEGFPSGVRIKGSEMRDTHFPKCSSEKKMVHMWWDKLLLVDHLFYLLLHLLLRFPLVLLESYQIYAHGNRSHGSVVQTLPPTVMPCFPFYRVR